MRDPTSGGSAKAVCKTTLAGSPRVFRARCSSRSFRRLPNWGGISESSLPESESTTRFVRLPISGGTGPSSRFTPRSRYSSAVSRPISGGIAPVMSLLRKGGQVGSASPPHRDSSLSSLRSPISGGRGPSRKLEERSSRTTWRFSTVTPNQEASLPGGPSQPSL